MAKILIVEDDPLISRMMVLRLSMHNHAVETAADGEQAVNRALAEQFDIILMDMHMPILDGRGATRQLREHGFDGLIIAVTASMARQDQEAAIKAGCDTVIAKPIPPDFESILEDWLSKR
ncbi:response regulator [Aestuariibacter sp. AA17]|uniref:Response regulator n=1 Tax=Fluctibacter corallii TaxID=2984329 RepID=A0ABT3A798_9ALTE|nr:response regulator [Aestuariibacter sp. AA17]MCV2884568.1 response regulator [Aestuariibacter sp. AA17]